MSLPVGSIILWKNTLESLPVGWQICNGSNGTPDLRALFVIGASSDGEVNTGSSSGSHTHTRPATTSSDGGHQHSISGGPSGSSGSVSDVRGTSYEGATAADAGHDHSGISGNTSGSTGAHSHSVGGNTNSTSISPPYLNLFYVMRIA